MPVHLHTLITLLNKRHVEYWYSSQDFLNLLRTTGRIINATSLYSDQNTEGENTRKLGSCRVHEHLVACKWSLMPLTSWLVSTLSCTLIAKGCCRLPIFFRQNFARNFVNRLLRSITMIIMLNVLIIFAKLQQYLIIPCIAICNSDSRKGAPPLKNKRERSNKRNILQRTCQVSTGSSNFKNYNIQSLPMNIKWVGLPQFFFTFYCCTL